MKGRTRIVLGLAAVAAVAAGIGVGVAATERDGGDGGPRWMGHGGGHHGHGGWRGERGGGRGDRADLPRTQEEFDARTRERFARLDRNGDGVLDQAEIEAMLSAHHGRSRDGGPMRGGRGGRGAAEAPPGAAPDATAGKAAAVAPPPGDVGPGPAGREFLRRFDANRDGRVTKDEFLAEIGRRFAELDLDNDGRITEADLPPVLRDRGLLTANPEAGGGPMSGPRHAGRLGRALVWLRSADANRDGIVTREEVMAHADKQFARLDRTKDGVVDAADFAQTRKEMVDYGVKRFLHMYGADKDGKVTREQFYAKARERFVRLESMGGEPGRGPGADGGRWRRGGPDRGPGGDRGNREAMPDGDDSLEDLPGEDREPTR